ncbi:MAG: hypothetical protein HYV09_32370 [Deltaproteobacteria bacterium]|nr:hypothetical protein [Deltaproteobacteria bacterium]
MRLLAALLASVLIVGSLPAYGQTIEQQYKTGVKLENAGDLVGALAAFESIPAAKRDFNARLHIASCKKKLGRLLEAEADYEAIRTDPKADPPTVDTAASDLEDLRPRIPKLVLKLSKATSGVKVTVDGKEATAPSTVRLNPGMHSVVAARGDAQVFKRDVTLAESTTIEVEVDAPAPASAPVVVATPSVAPKTDDTASGSAQRTWGWISIGTGAVFAVGAVGAWAYSGSLADKYLECTGRPESCDESKRDSVRTWETLSAVSAGVAIVGVGVGVTLLLTAPKANAVTVKAGLGGLSFEGRF